MRCKTRSLMISSGILVSPLTIFIGVLATSTTDTKQRVLVGHDAEVYAVAFSGDGTLLASLSYDDHTIRLWSVETGQVIQILSDACYVRGYSIGVAFSPDRPVLAVFDGNIYLYDRRSYQRTEYRGGGSVMSAFHPDGHTIAFGTRDGEVILWDAETGQMVCTDPTAHGDQVVALAFSPSGLTLASAAFDGMIRLWEIETGDVLMFHGPEIGVHSLTFTPDEARLISCSFESIVQFWDVGTGEEIDTLFDTVIAAEGFVAVALSTDGHSLALGSIEGTIYLWDIATEQVISSLEGHTGVVRSLAFSPDGRTLASGSYDTTVILWDTSFLVPAAPTISRMTFPASINVDEVQNGLVRFEDPDGDIVEARFEIVGGDESTIEIDPGLSFDPEVDGETEGTFRFTVRVRRAQTVTLRLTLVDSAGLESEPTECTFTVEHQ